MGNRAATEFLGVGQAKLAVGASDDRYEREADAIAKTVVDILRRGVVDDAGTSAERDVRAPIRRVSEVGTAGGELSPETEADIQRARGGGVPLDRSTRAAMEHAFGADFGNVRLHAGPEASNLNDRVQAKAFTIGSDVFFRDALPDVKTTAGQELLAHELTHTVQQGAAGAASSGPQLARKNTVQRMAFMNTRWKDAITAKVSSGGGLGVLFMNDAGGPPAVVKAGETFVPEATVAAQLLNTVAGGTAGGAPEARPVDEAEAAEIHAKAKELLEQANGGRPLTPKDNRREFNVLEGLEQRKGVMVYGYAKGVDLGEAFTGKEEEPNKQTKKGAFGKRKLREGSAAYSFFKSPDMMTTLGRAGAADVVLGNFDRLVGKLNLENIMMNLETGKLIWIDNVEAGFPALLATQTQIEGATAEAGFKMWANRVEVKALGKDNFDDMATNLLDMLGQEFNAGGGIIGKMRQEDRATVVKTFRTSRPVLATWFKNGMAAGKKAALAALRTVTKLAASAPEDTRVEVATSLIARRLVLQGTDPADAWEKAKKRLRREIPRTWRSKKKPKDKSNLPEPEVPPEQSTE